tara:strand:- start:361 stop:1497 length:1137 start_codon:yes stop_codon:yes gene_type:complete
MASIKLKHSGGNGVIIAAPTSNPASDKTLTLPSDVDGTVVSKDSSNSLQNIAGINGGQLGNRNLIINGAMQVAQRGTTETGVNSSGYKNAPDRWTHQIASSQSAYTVSQSTDSPDGFGNSYKIDVTTADTSLHADHAHFFRQKIEGQNLQGFAKGTSAAKQFELSFYVKTTKTGTYVVELYDIDNSRQISKTYTVSDTNWNRYTVTFPADTTGAFGNDNGASLAVQFWLSAGSNYTSGTLNSSAWASSTQANRVVGQVNFDDSTSNDWYLTGVQLEVGSVATDFEHRSFGQELALCQRYFFKIDTNVYATSYGTGNGHALIQLPQFVEMRNTPSFTHSSVSNGGDDGQALNKRVNYMWVTQSSGNAPVISEYTLDAEL